MAVIGTFGSFTTARLGIYASQSSLQVTGNNIANINTNGYTRQRADLVSLNSTGTAKYANPMGVDIGYGVLVKSTTQLRDPYLDIRYRNQNTQLAEADATLAGLRKISQTLDEVNKGDENKNGVIQNALMEFQTMLSKLAVQVGSEEYDGLVREAARSLTTFFNTAADKLQKDWDMQVGELQDTVTDVNKCLTNIRNLNEQIRKQGIYGDLALELRDARNLYIDELSGYMGINVEYSMERIDQYTEVEKLTITLKDVTDPNNLDKNGNPLPVKLIDGIYAGSLTIPESFPKENPAYDDTKPATGNNLPYLTEDGTFTDDPDKAEQIPNDKFLPQIEKLVDKKGRVYQDEKTYRFSEMVPLNDTGLTGSVQAMRELLTEEGEFASRNDVGLIDDTGLTAQEKELLARAADTNANIKKGIPYYQKRLDLLAQKFAEVFNTANQMPASDVYVTNAGADAAANGGDLFLNKKDGSTNFIDKDGRPVTISVSDVAIEIEAHNDVGTPILDKNDQPVKIWVPLDSTEAQLYGNPPPTDAQIQAAAEKLELLRENGTMKEEYEFYDGGVLFSNSGNNNDPTGITAANISIANSWAARTVRVLNTKQPDVPDPDDPDKKLTHSSACDNINHMKSLFEKQLTYSASELEPDASGGSKTFFHGSFEEMYTDLGATLGSQQSIIHGIAYNYEIMALDMDNDRLSVSGVDLNDEATNMMQFQKSYQAACRLMTTIDSMLDTLINNTLR